jgi:hypothetical protein
MYRTGDLCRFLEDGVIDFLGRMDDQVKVRGVRIELGEVEKAVAAHEAVQACGAAAEERDGETILAVYVIPAPRRVPSDWDLRSFLRRKLPQSLIPSEFLFVDEFPLSANGKIDRKRLALPRPAQAAAPQPRDGIERQVGAEWQRVLKHAQFSVHVDFFDSGGDSLSALDEVQRAHAMEARAERDPRPATPCRDIASRPRRGRAIRVRDGGRNPHGLPLECARHGHPVRRPETAGGTGRAVRPGVRRAVGAAKTQPCRHDGMIVRVPELAPYRRPAPARPDLRAGVSGRRLVARLRRAS